MSSAPASSSARLIACSNDVGKNRKFPAPKSLRVIRALFKMPTIRRRCRSVAKRNRQGIAGDARRLQHNGQDVDQNLRPTLLAIWLMPKAEVRRLVSIG